jgi:hypothetical protein
MVTMTVFILDARLGTRFTEMRREISSFALQRAQKA